MHMLLFLFRVQVGPQEMPKSSSLGQLRGSDNVVNYLPVKSMSLLILKSLDASFENFQGNTRQ